MYDTPNLISKLVNMMQPPNSIMFGSTDENGLVKPLRMLQPLPLGPYGFLEKLWPSYTNMNTPNQHEAVRIFEHHLDNDPVSYSSSSAADYTRYTLDDTVFKKRHIQESKQHIIIPSEALRDRSMICLMYEGGVYQKAQTGSFDILRWFMLLPSSHGPQLYPVEIKIEPNGQVKAGILTKFVHDQGLWTMTFEDPSVLATYIETYTKHVADALGRSRAQNLAPWTYEFDNDVMIYTNPNIDPRLLDKLRKSLGM